MRQHPQRGTQGVALNSQGLSQTGQSRLRRHVSGHLGTLTGASSTPARAVVDNRPTTGHQPEGGLGAKKGTSQGNAYYFVPRLDRHVDYGGELKDSGVVD